MKKLVIGALIALMVIPFALLASSDVAVPAEPVLTSSNVLYIADSACPAGSTASATGGTTAAAPLKTSGSAQKDVLYGKMAEGGKIVVVGKAFFNNTNNVFPETTSPVLFTAVDGDKSYISKDGEGNYNLATSGGQFGMFMINHTSTYTFECDVIFRDIVILNRLNETQATDPDKASTIIVKKSMVIENTVDFVEMAGNKGYHITVEEGAFLYLHAEPDGFDKYTGKGTIVIGDEIKDTVTEDIFAGFAGNIVDKNGKAVFGGTVTEPETQPETQPETEIPDPELPDTPDIDSLKRVYVAHDKYPKNPLKGFDTEFIMASASGGDTKENPYKTSGGWLPLYDKIKDGAVIVVAGKGFIGGDVTIPATSFPIMFTAVDGGVDYTSRDEYGSPYYTTATGGNAGQYGMFIIKENTTITFEGDVIFDNIVILSRIAKASVDKGVKAGTIRANGIMVVSDTVQFAEMTGKTSYTVDVGPEGVLWLETLGFENYTGTGVILLSEELAKTAAAADFEGFGGVVGDINGNLLFDFTGSGEPDAPETEPDAPETSAPETEYVPGDTTPVELPAKPGPTSEKNLFTAHDKNPDLGITASLTGGDSASDPFQTSKGWNGMAAKFKDGAKIVIVGKGFFGMDEVISSEGTLVFTAKHDGVDYTSRDAKGDPLFMNAAGANAGQYGMIMLKEDAIVTFDCDVVFEDIVLLGRLSANGVAGGHSEGTIVIRKTLWVKDSVEFRVMTGNVNHILELEAGAVAFLDAAGFTGYRGTGTIVLGDAIKDKLTPADFAGFKGKVVDKDGAVIYSFVEDPNAPIVIPERPTYTSDNKFYIAHDHNTDRDIQGSATGGAYAQVPYMTSKGWKTVSDWLKANNGGTLVVVGKGHIGGDFAFPNTDTPIVFTAKDNGTSYISRNDNGSIRYINEKGGNDGQFGMFMIAEAKKITFNGDVVFRDIVILSRQSKASFGKGNKPATIVVKKSLTVENSVQFANMTAGVNYILQVDEGAYAYLDRAGFFNYTGKGTIVIGDEIKDKVTAAMFGGFKGKVVDTQGNQLFEIIPDNPPTGDSFNPAFVAIIAVCALTMGAVLTFGLKKSR